MFLCKQINTKVIGILISKYQNKSCTYVRMPWLRYSRFELVIDKTILSFKNLNHEHVTLNFIGIVYSLCQTNISNLVNCIKHWGQWQQAIWPWPWSCDLHSRTNHFTKFNKFQWKSSQDKASIALGIMTKPTVIEPQNSIWLSKESYVPGTRRGIIR